MKSAVLIFMTAIALVGCSDKYNEGYKAGYAQGVKDAEARARADNERPTEAAVKP